MMIHWLAAAAILVVARVVFLLLAPAVRDCRWCTQKRRRWCLRCGGRRDHMRIGARSVHRAKLAVRRAIREWRAGR